VTGPSHTGPRPRSPQITQAYLIAPLTP
jgi:hypothetical protein